MAEKSPGETALSGHRPQKIGRRGSGRNWRSISPVLLSAPGPKLSPGSPGHPDPLSDTHPASQPNPVPASICPGKPERTAQGPRSPKIQVVLRSRFLQPGLMVQKAARFPETGRGRQSVLLGSPRPTPHAANTGTVRSCGRPKAQECVGSTRSCFYLAQKSLVGRLVFTPGSLTPWQGGTGHCCQK